MTAKPKDWRQALRDGDDCNNVYPSDKPPSAQTKVVPIEPTEEMETAATAAGLHASNREIWDAYIAAAPADSGAAQAVAEALSKLSMAAQYISDSLIYERKRIGVVSEGLLKIAQTDINSAVDIFAKCILSVPPQGFREGVEAAAKVCEQQGAQSDSAYHYACHDCADSIRALAAREGE